MTELRGRIDVLRASVGLGLFAYANATLHAAGTVARAQDYLDLRAALSEIYTTSGLPPPAYAEVIAVGTPIKAAHISELRAAIAAIE